MTLRRDLGALVGREHDVVVVGGGIQGAAIAWEAAQRGLTVALVEAADFASGASWNSLKTIHGGLRHLQRGHLSALRESMRERRTLLRIAPSLVRPLGFLAPAASTHELAVLATGLLANDALSLDRNRDVPEERLIPPTRRLGEAEVRALVPGLPEGACRGGVLWHDAQVQSSERLVLAFLHAAADAGAAIVSEAPAVALLRGATDIEGIRVRDGGTGPELDVRARVVVDAAGAGFRAALDAAGVALPPVPWLRAINIVLRREPPAPVAVGARHGGRYLFLVPWAGQTMFGTAYGPPEEDVRAQAAAFVADGRAAWPWFAFRDEDVALVHQGLVPGDARGLRTVSRVHDGARYGAPGLLSVEAVKFTTARATAEQAIDLACTRLGRGGPSRTAVTPLPQAAPLQGDLAARAVTAVRDEMARHLADAVLRRLDLGTGGPAADEDVDAVAGAMAGELGWDRARVAREKAALAAIYWRP